MTNTPRVKIGNAEVYATGSLVVRGDKRIEITPVPTGANPYRIEFIFTNVPDAPGRIEPTNKPDNLVSVEITNFSSPTGISNTDPLVVGNLGGKLIYLMVACYNTGIGESTVRVLSYTLTLGEL